MIRESATGLLLLVGYGSWALLSSPAAPGSTRAAAGALVVGAGWLAGRLLAARRADLPGLLVAGAVAVTVLATAPASLSGAAAAPPLGYANANGALLVAGAAGVCLAATRGSLRGAGAAVAAGVALVCAALGALASVVACLLLALWTACRGRVPPAVTLWTAGALAVTTAGLPLLYGVAPVRPPGWLVAALSPERFALWRDAVDLVRQEPVQGTGPGTFAALSPTARADPDLAWAHSYLLQTAAELGLVGVALLVLLLLWAAVSLRDQAPALAALLLPASVDYVLGFGWVLVAFSVVLGGGSVLAGIGKPGFTPSSP